MERKTGFYSESHSVTGIEPFLTKHVFERAVRWVPASVHPNALSLANHAMTWSVFLAAATAPYLSPRWALTARIYAALGTFGCLVLDNIDGMHARATGQTSKLGEVMDHWLDAINVPLMAGALILTLELDPFTTAVGMIVNTLIYNIQLVLYHHSGRFVHPEFSGVDSQMGIVFAYMIIGVLFYFLPRESLWVARGVLLFAWICIVVALINERFYAVRTREHLLPHLIFAGFCVGAAALFLAGTMPPAVYCVAVTMVSFRMTGSYVLFTVLERPYAGVDWSIAVWLPLMAAGWILLEPFSVWGYGVRDALPYLFFLYIVAMNLIDLFRNLPVLAAGGRKSNDAVTP